MKYRASPLDTTTECSGWSAYSSPNTLFYFNFFAGRKSPNQRSDTQMHTGVETHYWDSKRHLKVTDDSEL